MESLNCLSFAAAIQLAAVILSAPDAGAAVAAPKFEGERTLVLERTAHSRREQFIQQITGHDGQTLVVTNEYTVLGTGMHYFENGIWKETSQWIPHRLRDY